VIIADRQTGGKGRLDRTWESPAGLNIYLSIVIRPELEPKNVTMLTILAAVAGAAALRKTCNIPVSIKWPNDLVIADKKLGGILTEVRADPDRINLAVIGIGINVNMTDKDFPEEIRYSATSVKQETGTVFSRNEIIIQLPNEVKVETKTERRSNPVITLTCMDKQLIGHVAAKIRSLRPPEPYKGKGIKFVGEQLRRKAGKSASV